MDTSLDSWILASVEEGAIFWEDAGGSWHTEGREAYVRDGGEFEVLFDIVCEETPEIQSKVEREESFCILFTGVSFIAEEGHLDRGYVFPCAWVEYTGWRLEDIGFEVKERDDG